MKIDVKGVIVSNDDKWIYDLFEYDAVCPRDISAALDKTAGGEINVYISSPGGSLYDGLEIYAMLRDYSGPTKLHIVGRAHSAASAIACAGYCDIVPGGTMMLHNVSGAGRGDHNDMSKTAEALRQHDISLADVYAAKTGKPEGDILAMMERETWLTAQEAVEMGLVDAISQEAVRPVASACMPLPPPVIEKIRNMIKTPPGNTTDIFMQQTGQNLQARLNLLKLEVRK